MLDYAPGAIVYLKFATVRPSTGAPFTLAGTPAISVYKDNSTTQSTSGVTLTVDFDSVTGLNHVTIDTSADGTFYAAGSSFQVVITTGTVDSVSVVGQVVGEFTLNRASVLRPTTAGRTLDVTATGAAGIDLGNVENQNATLNLTATTVEYVSEVASVTATVDVNVIGWKGSTPNDLVSGRVDGSVGAMAANTLTASALASDAVTEIQSGLATASALSSISTVQGSHTSLLTSIASGIVSISDYIITIPAAVWSVVTRTITGGTVTTVSDKTGYSLATAPLDAAGTRAALGLASNNLDTQLATLATASSLSTVGANVVDIQGVTDKLDTAMAQDGSVYRFTANALELAPTGSGGGGSSDTIISGAARRNLSNTSPIHFTFPTANLTNSSFTTKRVYLGESTTPRTVEGTITFLYTRGNKHWYSLSYDADDRPASPMVGKYEFSDGTSTVNYEVDFYNSLSQVAVLPGRDRGLPQSNRGRVVVAQGELITISRQVVDGNGNPVNLAGRTLQIVIQAAAGTDVAVVPNSGITIGGTNNDTYSFVVPSAASAKVGSFTYSLNDVGSSKAELASGDWIVKQRALADS